MQLKFVSLNISLCLCRFGSGVTSCPYSKFQDLSLLAVAVLFFCGDVGYFFVSGGRGGTAIESNRISRLRCCTQSVLATFSFLHKKSLPTTSSQFHRKKTTKKLQIRASFKSFLVCVYNRELCRFGQELFLKCAISYFSLIAEGVIIPW